MATVQRRSKSAVKRTAAKTALKLKSSAIRKKKTKELAAKKQAHKIMQAINEAEQIHAGKKQGKSFSKLLAEI